MPLKVTRFILIKKMFQKVCCKDFTSWQMWDTRKALFISHLNLPVGGDFATCGQLSRTLYSMQTWCWIPLRDNGTHATCYNKPCLRELILHVKKWNMQETIPVCVNILDTTTMIKPFLIQQAQNWFWSSTLDPVQWINVFSINWEVSSPLHWCEIIHVQTVQKKESL